MDVRFVTEPLAGDELKREKVRLRLEMRARLESVSADDAVSAGRSVSERLASLSVWIRATRIALFASRVDEIDTGPLFDRARRAGKRILFPRLGEARALEFRVAASLRDLVVGPYGLNEPPREAERIELGTGDLLVVPGLAFDRQGGRLGRGGGYYDRALAGFGRGPERPACVGVGFSFQLVDRVPIGELDEALDYVVTADHTVERIGEYVPAGRRDR